MKSYSLIFVAAILIAGCSSTTNQPAQSKRKVLYDYETFKPVSVDEIKAKLAENPGNPQPYFLMGEYHESNGQLLQALDQFIKGTVRFKNANGYDPKKKYTGGHYRIGRVYARLSKYNSAIVHLSKVVAMEPRELRASVLNYQFRETHYLLGACYKETLDFKKAEYHFKHFMKLGGEDWRALPHLAEIKKDTQTD
jgi:tetratricopeptide (TPR) repeat protein